MSVAAPVSGEYNPAFARYVARVEDADIVEALDRQTNEVRSIFAPLSDERADYRYEPGKWSVREMLGHLVDTERVMGYRAMALARGEAQVLPGFDENDYAAAAPYGRRPLRETLQQFAHLRESHVLMFRQLSPEDWLRRGTVAGHPASVRAFAWIIVGHVRHHLAVLAQRYGIGA
jgi:hypothetical protein